MMPRCHKLIMYSFKRAVYVIFILAVAFLTATIWTSKRDAPPVKLSAKATTTTTTTAAPEATAPTEKIEVKVEVPKPPTQAPVERAIIRIMPHHRKHKHGDAGSWYGEKHGTGVFKDCLETKCGIVTEPKEADVVLISSYYLDRTDHKGFRLPVRPNFRQKWIFYSIDAPQHTRVLPKFQHLFNGTFTYMATSDAYRATAEIVPLEKPLKVSYEDENWVEKKNVVWMVSHCNTPGGRDVYVEELSKHIGVTTYGNCGTEECPHDQDCLKRFETSFKFYLAFEDSLCPEYVSENLFKAMHVRMIPIVYGLFDYKNNLPKHSFIDVRDFDSPKHLADYLKVLASDKTLFDSYLKWKEYFEVADIDYFMRGTCQLCEYLHRTKHDPHKTVHLDEFWSADKMCVPQEKFLPSVGVPVSGAYLNTSGPVN